MSVTLQGEASASATTITIPSHQAGDLIIISASRANNTPPTLPSGWTNITGAGANTLSLRTGYLIATGSSHTSGTWSNAARLTCLVFRPSVAGATLDIGVTGTVSGSAQTYQRYPALTLTQNNSLGAVVYTYTRNNTSGITTAPSGYTNINSIATAPVIGAHRRFDVSANPTQEDVTSLTSGNYRTHGMEITYTPPPNAPPTVVLNTTNENVFSTDTPTLEFTGTDPNSDDICYEIEIRDTPYT